MRTSIAFLTILLGGWMTAASAEVIVLPPRDCHLSCRWRVTQIDQLWLPDLNRKDLPPVLELGVKSWEPSYFEDGAGRRWVLFRGNAITAKPDKLSGWIVHSVYGQEFFYTNTGVLFRIQPARPAARPQGDAKDKKTVPG
jgi:hypothetical protein